jgi:hypothetical protein
MKPAGQSCCTPQGAVIYKSETLVELSLILPHPSLLKIHNIPTISQMTLPNLKS